MAPRVRPISHFSAVECGCLNMVRGVIPRSICCDTMSGHPVPCLSRRGALCRGALCRGALCRGAGVRICQHRPSTRERPCGWRTVRSKVQRPRPGRVRYCGIESAHRARPSARLQLLEHKHCRHLRLQSLLAVANH